MFSACVKVVTKLFFQLPGCQTEKFGCLQKTVLKSHKKPKIKRTKFYEHLFPSNMHICLLCERFLASGTPQNLITDTNWKMSKKNIVRLNSLTFNKKSNTFF